MPSEKNTPDSLQSLRQRIDALDSQIVSLLNDRAKVVIEVGQLKQKTHEPIYAPDREKAVLEKLEKLNKGPLPTRCLQAVYRELMSGSFFLERPLRIGFLGPEGTYSHLAATRKFGSSVTYVPLSDIPSVFEEVVHDHIEYGLVPVENSIGGGIVDTLDALLLASSVKVSAEVLITVHHNLLAKGPWEKVTRILSKPEVFTQCRKWISAIGKGRDIVPCASTAKAAELAATDPTVAAIGSTIAAEINELNVLFENIEDNPDNVTRFLVIGREVAKRTGDDKTALMFTIAHKPGALADILGIFKRHQINLTDIEKRPGQKVNWEYYFFIDAQGHAEDPNMKSALAEAKQYCVQFSILGSYPRATEVL